MDKKRRDPGEELCRGILDLAAGQGVAALQNAWENLPAKYKALISKDNECPESYKKSARVYEDITNKIAGVKS